MSCAFKDPSSTFVLEAAASERRIRPRIIRAVITVVEAFQEALEMRRVAHGIDRALKLGFTAGKAHRDAIAQFQLRLFTSDPQYPKANGAPYIVSVGTAPAGTIYYDSYATFPFYTPWAEVRCGGSAPRTRFPFYRQAEGAANRLAHVLGADAALDTVGQVLVGQAVQRAAVEVAELLDDPPVAGPQALDQPLPAVFVGVRHEQSSIHIDKLIHIQQRSTQFTQGRFP